MGHGANAVLDKGFKVLSTYNSSAAAGVLAYRVVKVASDTIDLQTASNALSLGVVQESVDQVKVATGKVVANVRLEGTSKCVAGAAITQGVEVMATTAGKVIAATGSGNRVIGVALSAASADGDYVDVQLSGAAQRLIP